jgi:hypothetical protein
VISRDGDKKVLMFSGSETALKLCQRNSKVFLVPNMNSPKELNLSTLKYEAVLKMPNIFNVWIPSLARHNDQGDQFELILNRLMGISLDWATQISQINCEFAVIESAASHHLNTICFEMACRIVNLKIIFLDYSSFNNRLIPMLQTDDYDTRVRLNLELNEWKFSEDLLDLENHKWLKRTAIGPKGNQRTFFVIGKLFMYRILNFLREIRQRTSFRMQKTQRNFMPEDLSRYRLSTNIKVICQQGKALRFLKKLATISYDQILSINRHDSDFFVFMAHVQPEASSFPLAGHFANQLQLVREIRQRYPKIPFIYREHPHIVRRLIRGQPSKVGIARSKDYYQQLKDLGCLFVEGAESELMVEIQKNPRAKVITLGGKIAIERGLKGMPTIVAGNPWYKGMPGTISLKDLFSTQLEEIDCRRCSAIEIKNWITEVHSKKTIASAPWSVIDSETASEEDYLFDLNLLIEKTYRI